MENEDTPKTERTATTQFRIESDSVGKTPGRFRAVLASSGEASDGDILSIKGMKIAPSLPMMFRHQSSIEIPALGRIIEPKKDKEGDLELLRVTGVFDLESKDDRPDPRTDSAPRHRDELALANYGGDARRPQEPETARRPHHKGEAR